MSSPSESVKLFTTQSKTVLSQGSQLATALPSNTTQVWPGGATFTTIQAAIDSITGAGPQVQYQVAVGPGTYNENVTMKDYVYVIGAGQGITIITAQGQMNFASGTVNSASCCGIGNLSIVATGGSWGACPMGIKICGAGEFHISGVTINSSDSNLGGNNVRGISNEVGSYSGNVIVGSSTINVSGAAQSGTTGIEGFGSTGGAGFTLFIELTTINVLGTESYGVTTAVGASATLEDSKIIATVWALYNSDGMSPITANQCTISGPVSSGVTVNN